MKPRRFLFAEVSTPVPIQQNVGGGFCVRGQLVAARSLPNRHSSPKTNTYHSCTTPIPIAQHVLSRRYVLEFRKQQLLPTVIDATGTANHLRLMNRILPPGLEIREHKTIGYVMLPANHNG